MVIFWFRRDLRIDDNHALFRALKSGFDVLPIFIFDTDITNKLNKNDHRYLVIIALYKKAKFCEIKVSYFKREYGISKFSSFKINQFFIPITTP